jgi:hypothetical protein
MQLCNISEGPVNLSGQSLYFNGESWPGVAEFGVTGSFLVSSVTISSSFAVMALSELSVNVSTVIISQSTVTLVLMRLASVRYLSPAPHGV